MFLPMKRSPSSLRSLAASATAANMSVRPSYRGGSNQWRSSRAFSYRPHDNGADDDHFISGDSHFQSVRDSNRGGRPVERGPYYPNYSRVPPPYDPRPSINQNQHFRPPGPPHFNQNQRFCPPAPSHFNQNQGFRPPVPPHFNQYQPFRLPRPGAPYFCPPQQFRPRPPRASDFRGWEYAKPGPPTDCERFTVLSYNILADYLALNHRNQLYYHIPHYMLEWEFRKRNILSELGWWSADILCFQEVDRFHDLENELNVRGYSGIWKMRTGDPVDGCAIFWRDSRFKLLHEEFIEFNKLGLRDNVAQICVLESMNRNNSTYAPAFPESLSGANRVVVCNIHVLYNPKRGEIKLGQVRVLLEKAHTVSKLWDDAPVVVCGDFNCTPKSAVYNFISERKLNVSELPRDKLSGQASAEIRSPWPYNPNPRPPFGPPSSIDDKEIKQNDTPQDLQNISSSHINLENVSCVSSLDQSQSKNVLNVSASSSIKGQHDDRNKPSSYELMKDDHDNEDVCKGGIELTHFQVCGSSGSPSSSGDMASSSRSVDFHPDIKMPSREETYTTSTVSCELSRKLPQTQSAESEILNRKTGMSDSASVLDTPASVSNLDRTLSDPLDLVSNSIEYSPPETSENLVNNGKDEGYISDRHKSADSVVDDKTEKLSSIEVGEGTDDRGLGEDSARFLSELHCTDSHLPTDLNATSSSVDGRESDEECSAIAEVLDDLSGNYQEPCIGERTPYDPSYWTPMEIENATGSSECTFIEHSIKLRSTYSEVEDLSGTRDSNGEPQVTSYHRRFFGTVDYIWRSEGLQTVRVRAPMKKQAMQWTPGFPTKKWGSDHIALVTELAFRRDDNIQDSIIP